MLKKIIGIILIAIVVAVLCNETFNKKEAPMSLVEKARLENISKQLENAEPGDIIIVFDASAGQGGKEEIAIVTKGFGLPKIAYSTLVMGIFHTKIEDLVPFVNQVGVIKKKEKPEEYFRLLEMFAKGEAYKKAVAK